MNAHDKNLVIVRSVVDQGLGPAHAAFRFGVSRQWGSARDGRMPRRIRAVDSPDATGPVVHVHP